MFSNYLYDGPRQRFQAWGHEALKAEAWAFEAEATFLGLKARAYMPADQSAAYLLITCRRINVKLYLIVNMSELHCLGQFWTSRQWVFLEHALPKGYL